MERGTDGTEQWKEELVELHDGTAMQLKNGTDYGPSGDIRPSNDVTHAVTGVKYFGPRPKPCPNESTTAVVPAVKVPLRKSKRLSNRSEPASTANWNRSVYYETL